MPEIIRFGHHGKGGGGKVDIDYHWVFSLAEIKVVKKPIISFSSSLGDILFIGDGSTKEFYLPNKWEKIYYFNGGYGWKGFYPSTVILYQDSINNQLISGVDYTYDSSTGKVTLTNAPAKNSLIAGTLTYNSSKPKDTTFYASFAFAELFKRIGFKYYKLDEPYFDTYPKVASMSKALLDTIWIPMMSGKVDLVYNPTITIGQTVYVKDPKTGFDNVIFIKGFDKQLGNSPSVSAEVLNYPAAMELGSFGQKSITTSFKPQLSYMFVSFIDETADDSDYYGAGLWFRAEVLDLYGSKFNIFKNPVEVDIMLDNKVRKFPSSENDYNSYHPKNKRGVLTQYYVGSFRKVSGGEFADDNDLANTFPEFFDADNPKLFSFKTVTFSVKDAKTLKKDTIALGMIFGHKRPYKGYFVPSYPYEPFTTFYKNRNHILTIDKDKNLWEVDTFFNSIKIDNLDFLTSDSFCIITAGKDLMIIDDQAHFVKRYDVSSKTYEEYEIDDCLCGCNVFLNYKNVTDDLSNPLFYFRGYSNITDTPYSSYVNFIKYKPVSNEMVKSRWMFTLSDTAFAGIPFTYKNVVYFGRIGMNLYNASSYEGTHEWTAETDCPLIVDNSNAVFRNDFSLNKIKALYITDLLENNLWVIGSDCSSASDYILTQPRVIGKDVIFGKRVDSIYDSGFDPSTDSTHWEKIAKFTSPLDDINSWDITPIAVYGDKIMCLVKGTYMPTVIQDYNFGLAVFDAMDKKLHFKIIKYFGNPITGSDLEVDIVHSVWFKDKILFNWQDLSYLLKAEDIITVSGV